MAKLVVCVMGQNCMRFIGMCLESVKDADAIVYCDGGSTDMTMPHIKANKERWGDVKIITNPYNQKDKTMNGKQRNFYLNYLKKNHPDDWALCLDADEVVGDLDKIKEMIQNHSGGLWSVKMRHFIGDLGHEDSIVPEHFVLNRLFKISDAVSYPEVEHPVLSGEVAGQTNCTTIWHLAYIPNLWEIKKRYDSHLAKSNMHTPEYLRQWRNAHLFGQYPRTPINLIEIPSIILDTFGVNKDELYFKDRNIEVKHFIDAEHWRDYFKCKTATEFGCGKGPRVYALNSMGVNTNGLEISQYAVNNKMHPKIIQTDVTNSFAINPVDLVIAYDLLEHISYEKLDHTIQNLIKSSKLYILVSVPVIGDPNLEADPTHVIKETKKWWIKKFTDKGLKSVEVPNHFLFKDQLMIFKK